MGGKYTTVDAESIRRDVLLPPFTPPRSIEEQSLISLDLVRLYTSDLPGLVTARCRDERQPHWNARPCYRTDYHYRPTNGAQPIFAPQALIT